MLTPQQLGSLKNLLQSPQWKIVEAVAEEFCNETKQASPLRNTEWDTIRELLRQEGKVEGVKNLLQKLYQYAGEAK